jgi:ligand-binding sensor domain-containing protein
MCIANITHCQEYNYYRKTYTIQDGLPNNDIKWITQDNSGFLWIGTWDGLVRYDGSEFKVYRHDPNDTNSLGYFEVSMICVDAYNQVWTHSANKLCRYEPALDHFKSYNKYDFPETDSSESTSVFRIILLDPFGQMYVRYKDGLYKYDQNNDKFQQIYFKDFGIDHNLIYYFSFDNEGNFWIFQIKTGEEYGWANLCSINSNDTLSIIHKYPVEQKFFEEYLLNVTFHVRMFRNSTGNTWIATSNGLYRLSEDTIREFQGKIPPGEFSGYNIVLWTQPGQGLMVFYPVEGQQDTVFRSNEVENVVAYFTDKQDNIWFTNYNSSSKKSGLGLMYRTGNYFKHYLNEINEAIPFAVFGLIKDKSGNIWAGGRPNDHIVKITPEGKVKKIKIPIDSLGNFNYPRDMALDSEGNIWIAFYNDYLYKLNPKNNEFTDYSNKGILGRYSNYNPRYRIVKLLRDGRLITGGGGRIFILNKENFSGIFSDNPHFTDSYAVYEDPHGYIWIGLNGRLIKSDWNLSKQEIIVISENNYNIEDICPGDSSDLWLASLGGGIGHLMPDRGTTTFFTTFNGLAHNTVYSIKKDRSGNLWASHDLGISMLNPQTKNIVNFNEKDGLHIKEFDSEAAFQTEDGEMLFGGLGGIVSFYPDSVKMNRQETSTKLLFTDFKVSNMSFNFNMPLSELESVRLPKGTDNFQLELIKPDLRNGKEIRYRYKLNGTNEDWIVTDSHHRRVNYISLRPGNYNFLAEATDLNGDWKYKTYLNIDIPSFFYQTLLFKILLILLSLGILLLIFIMKLKQSRLKEWQKYEQLKLETLHSQMNPHFIFNALNSVNYFITLNDQDKANLYLTDLSRLLRAIMSNSSQDFIPLESEIQTLKDYLALEHSQLSDLFEYEIQIDDLIDKATIEVVPSLIQPFVENAIRHGLRQLKGRKGKLAIRLYKGNESFLVCYIEDDGTGRRLSMQRKTDEQRKRRSRGISIVEERLDIINSLFKTKFSLQISDLYNDREEAGTKVRIDIPVKTIRKLNKISEL